MNTKFTLLNESVYEYNLLSRFEFFLEHFFS